VLQNTFVNIYRSLTLIGQSGEFSFVMRDMFHKVILNLHVASITNICSVVFQSQKITFLKIMQAYLVFFYSYLSMKICSICLVCTFLFR